VSRTLAVLAAAALATGLAACGDSGDAQPSTITVTVPTGSTTTSSSTTSSTTTPSTTSPSTTTTATTPSTTSTTPTTTTTPSSGGGGNASGGVEPDGSADFDEFCQQNPDACE